MMRKTRSRAAAKFQYSSPLVQLTLYALAISNLTGIRLFDIKYAWFNEEQY